MIPKIQTSRPIVPIIYCYTTPGVSYHDGWCKIGQSEQDARTRVSQQTQTADIHTKLEWTKNATFDDGSGEIFRDSDFHAYLTRHGIERMKPQPGDQKAPEWFRISPEHAKQMLNDFREHRAPHASTSVVPYTLRKEQQEAVQKAKAYFLTHPNGKFLFNCKPRFGKTLTVYDLSKEMQFTNVLIVTNRPAIANSWYDDYCKFLGPDSGYDFVSRVDALTGKPLVLSREQFIDQATTSDTDRNCIEFVSLQDLKGSKYFNPHSSIDKLREVADVHWDILVIDEAHEGVDTYKTDVAFQQITRKYTLHLSGTPFKALANGDFASDAIYNWTYADEQKAKAHYISTLGDANPYAILPRLNLFTYQMSTIIQEELQQGIEIQGETEEYAFDLNEFFATDKNGRFLHDSAVNRFLDSLVTGKKYPFSTPELRQELRHTLWLLNRVESAKALERKLQQHPVFGNGNYEIILAAGDGKTEADETVTEKAFNRVQHAIATHSKTITLSVGQLTTGVTIPEWSAVLMLANVQSEALYMQAAFRAQNPCLFHIGKQYLRKQNAYVFDFDPARTLIIFEKFANNLSERTAGGNGTTKERQQHIRELLNFFPVIGEDDQGEMTLLDASKVLSIPRKIKATEVVRRGFMSNYLFQNIHNIFGAPQEILDILQQIPPVKKEPDVPPLTPTTGDTLSIGEDGNVHLAEEDVAKTANQLFGDKIYGPAQEAIADAIQDTSTSLTETAPNEKPAAVQQQIDQLQKQFADTTKQILDTAQETYQNDLSARTRNQLEQQINQKAQTMLQTAADTYQVQKNQAEAEHEQAVQEAATESEAQRAEQKFQEKLGKIQQEFTQTLQEGLQEQVQRAGQTVVQHVETDKKEKKKRSFEEDAREHLRGFTRTIPSFLMAYGTKNTTLATFEQGIPPQVFFDVTSITIPQFLALRDGNEHYAGHFFDEVVFNDSVQEFLHKKELLANYFDAQQQEDIFDYIPPQKTNQIFTPRKIVKLMVDQLEQENPGCFDRDDLTFADLYMKSGMYLTEIIQRLYNSPKLKELYPDRNERLNHIFSQQVYGLAPTEIIYRICLAYILGFSDKIQIPKHNIRLCDALEEAKKGTLEEKLRELFPELNPEAEDA